MPIEILLPEETREALVNAPKLAAAFIEKLTSCAEQVQYIEVSGGMVVSGNKQVSDFLTMVLRAKKFGQFIEELRQLLFPSAEAGSLGILRCIRSGKNENFQIAELKSSPNIMWKIFRVT